MEQNNVNTVEETVVEESTVSTPPAGFQVIVREFLKDKIALFALILLALIFLIIFIGPYFIDQETALKVNILGRYKAPSNAHLLGTDESGRDVFSITILTCIIGIFVGLISGYYGKWVDTTIMRVVDFIMILPTLMIIIVFVTVIPNYTMVHFVLIMTAFYWVGSARLFRTRTLQEASLDYVNASKTLGSSDLRIMFREILPNLSSLIIVNLILRLAGNIGIETGLTYLGFGLPFTTPSLGTLISAAKNADIIQNKLWVWLPATILIFVMMLCINYVGQALQRAADSRQRLG